MERSPLNTIPAEIRNLIFEYALQLEQPIKLRFDLKSFPRIRQYKHGNLLALSQTCKQIRKECYLRFFAVNVFRMKLERGVNMMMGWDALLNTFGKQAVAALCSIEVKLDGMLCFHGGPWGNPATGKASEAESDSNELFLVLEKYRAWQLCNPHCQLRVLAPTCVRKMGLTLDLKDLDEPWRKMLDDLEADHQAVYLAPNCWALERCAETVNA